MLKKSAEKLIETRSVMAVLLPMDWSRFQNPSPLSGFAKPSRPSFEICTLRNSLRIFGGCDKRFRPVPLPGVEQLGLLPADPAPVLHTLPCTLSPKLPGSTSGICPTANPKMVPPPQTWLLSVTVSGSPLNAEKIPETKNP